MDLGTFLKRCDTFCEPYRVSSGKDFKLSSFDPGDTAHLTKKDKQKAKEALKLGVDAMADLQSKLYAQDRWAVLLIFQAMDAAGKDSAIKHVMSGVNPQGCEVYSFKAPSAEDLDHDYLWRCLKRLPARGHIGIFNRSYYEETLVVRVHEELLKKQKLPRKLLTKNIWKQRFEDIRNVEKYLSRNGVVIRKFFLHVSPKEQKKRFLDRLNKPEKHWKFSEADVHERQYWDQYMKSYEEMIQNTSTSYAPWYVVPADSKWFTRVVVASAVVDTLRSLDLQYPKVAPERMDDLAVAREKLMKE